MAEDTIQNQEVKIDNIIDGKILTNEELTNIYNNTSIEKLKRLNSTNTNPPTYTPQSFQEQFYMQTGGLLWVYINGGWVNVNNPIANLATGSDSRTIASGAGDQKITCGFRPKLIKITAQAKAATSDNNGDSVGTSSAVGTYNCLYRYYYTTSSVWVNDSRTDYIISVFPAGTGTGIARASLTSIDNDGFTLNWVSVGVECKFIWEVIG